MEPSEEIARISYSVTVWQEFSTEELESYFVEHILPHYGITQQVQWQSHIKTHPDNFLHVFTVKDTRYALAFDDYPSGFSIDGEKFIHAIKDENGIELLSVSSPDSKYAENITGYFKLFRIINDGEFSNHVSFLINQYEKLLDEWQNDSKHLVSLSRDLLQMAEIASANHDTTTLHSINNFVDTLIHLDAVDNSIDLAKISQYISILIDAEYGYELYSEEQRKQISQDIYSILSREVSSSIKNLEYGIKNLGQTLVLVNAMYARQDGDVTSGITVSLLVDERGVSYPRNHFVNDEIKLYMLRNPHISVKNIEDNMPESLAGHRLVEGSVSTQKIFRRELGYISF